MKNMNRREPASVDAAQLRKLVTEIPKTEIHLHLEGLASVETIWQLMNRHKILLEEIPTKEVLRKRFQVGNFDEFIDLFINVIQNCFTTEEDFEYLIDDARDYLKRNGIVYTEMHFAPSKFLINGLSYKTLVEKLDSGARRLKDTEGIELRFLIDVSRTYGVENAQKNLELVAAHPVPSVIGIGLGGAERQGPARDYRAVFQQAIAKGFRVVAHAGEVIGPESIWDSVRLLKASRIGHGISAIQDTELMDYLAGNRIALEICPTSNLFTRHYVQRIEDHPIRAFYDRGMLVTVNTDDPSVFGVELIEEYMNLFTNGIFSAAEILALATNNIAATFLPESRKQELVAQTNELALQGGLVS